MEQEEKKLPDGLEKAAGAHIRRVVDAAGHPGWDWETQDIAEAFIAGAEWMKAKMMEEAVNGRVYRINGRNVIENLIVSQKFQDGDKVKVIVIKEDEL